MLGAEARLRWAGVQREDFDDVFMFNGLELQRDVRILGWRKRIIGRDSGRYGANCRVRLKWLRLGLEFTISLMRMIKL